MVNLQYFSHFPCHSPEAQTSQQKYRSFLSVDPPAGQHDLPPLRQSLTSTCHSQQAAFAGAFVILLPVFFPNLFGPLGRASPSMFSEWNAPKPMHGALLEGALQRKFSIDQQISLWSPLANQGWKPCNESPKLHSPPEKSQGYIQVFLDGGLNQQKMGICDAVAVAKILNVTLVIPHFEVNPVWQDSSSFAEIFDVDHFIDALHDEVSIVKELPGDYSWSTREYYATGIRATRIKTAPVHATADWYIENVLPVIKSYGIAAIAPFSHRLTFNNLPSDIQRLRCKVNFEALAFVPHVKELGEALIHRLRHTPSINQVARNGYVLEGTDRSENQQTGKFVVLHLRFDKDMAAHSSCDFGGGKAEKLALAKYRQVIWQGRVSKSQFTDEELRNQGRCPLTPEEIGLLLAALGFNNRTRLYLASHKVYGGEARIASLRKLFPLMEDKRGLASAEERSKVEGKASLLAAVDYYVSLHSDIFISASPGNMHNALVGHRAYLNMKTIRPNMALLSPLFLNKSMDWLEFQRETFPFLCAENSRDSAEGDGVTSSSIGSVRFEPSSATPRTILSFKEGLTDDEDAVDFSSSGFDFEELEAVSPLPDSRDITGEFSGTTLCTRSLDPDIAVPFPASPALSFLGCMVLLFFWTELSEPTPWVWTSEIGIGWSLELFAPLVVVEVDVTASTVLASFSSFV
ncbi:O-fucosyltransferase 31-like [Senna tora]|uniref:O-fucosyltransferase family protein n=1 Tax=Senna tora TaxID=362788 RepID=A0A834T8F6_9FABA|nr:O-fucosyltransferase 31-like [Senna tora]